MIKEASIEREDISQFVVHLTRDDSEDFDNGSTAIENLKSILTDKKILATRAHCIFNKEISKFPEKRKKQFRVACFTETPLSQIHLLARKIEGRRNELEPYGLVFRKETLIKKGAQQAIYINSYNENRELRDATRELFDICKRDPDSHLNNLVPYLNAMHERYDFTWEREWRVAEDFKFKASDIVAVILPNGKHLKFRSRLAGIGIATISPNWTYEQIVYELASQQRKTRRISVDGKGVKWKREK